MAYGWGQLVVFFYYEVDGVWGAGCREGNLGGCSLIGGAEMTFVLRRVGPGCSDEVNQMGFDVVATVSLMEVAEEVLELLVINGEGPWRDAKVLKVSFHKAVEGNFWVDRSL